MFVAAKSVVEPANGLTVEVDASDALSQHREHALALQARRHLPHAGVDADTEADVTGCAALDIELVWALPATRISVRRAEEEQDLVIRVDPDAADIDGLGRRAEESLHR